MENILVDSGFWFALYNPGDQHHRAALGLADYLDLAHLVIPFPTLYETLNTAFMRNPLSRVGFENVLQRDNVRVVTDEPIKQAALSLTFSETGKRRSLSLVDHIIRLMLEDESYRIDCLVTFNVGDFIDICTKRRIPIINQ